MRFFSFIASLFESDKPTSASRFLAFMAMNVLCGGVTYFFYWCKVPGDHITVFQYLMWFIGALVGLFKIGDIVALRTGVKVTETREVTPTGTTASIEKTVTGVEQKPADEKENN